MREKKYWVVVLQERRCETAARHLHVFNSWRVAQDTLETSFKAAVYAAAFNQQQLKHTLMYFQRQRKRKEEKIMPI